ncbi:MAG: hypothetical protein GY930_11255 [bacterium]|nr:hypothetical protein [bacterium]
MVVDDPWRETGRLPRHCGAWLRLPDHFSWRNLNGYTLLADIIRGVSFKDVIKVDAA